MQERAWTWRCFNMFSDPALGLREQTMHELVAGAAVHREC